MSIDCNRVRAWLKSRWQVTVPDDWLTACIEWIQSEHEGLPLDNSGLNQMVYEQWLVSDLRELGVASLPQDLAENPKVVLKGNYCLQVNSLVDASTPYYGQLTKLTGKENENVHVTASTQQTQQPWEAKPTRMLIMTMTDGVQEVQGMEYRPIPAINLKLSPGIKVLVRGEVICRRGMIMLKPENLTLLGGEVEAMVEENTLENNIQRILYEKINSCEQNRALGQPQTARKEFPVAPRQGPKSESVRPTWTDAPSHNQYTNPAPQRPQHPNPAQRSQDATPAPNRSHTSVLSTATTNSRLPTHDEWGDEDMEMMFGHLDDELTQEPQWADDDADLEAMLDDDLDEEILLSQEILIPQQGQSATQQAAPTSQKTTVPAQHTTQYSKPQAAHTGQRTTHNNQQTIHNNPSTTTHTNLRTTSTYTNQQTTFCNQQTTFSAQRPVHVNKQPASAGIPSPLPSRTNQPMTNKPANVVTPWRENSGVKEPNRNIPNTETSNRTATPQPAPGPSTSASTANQKSISLDSKPFTYLSKVKESWPPATVTDITVKAYVATLLDKLEHGNGQGWSLRAKINDGSAVMDVILSNEILTSLIGFSASECMRLRGIAKQDKVARQRLTTGIKSCQESLINMSAMLAIRLDPAESAPVVLRHRPVTLEDLVALHDRNKPH